MKLSTMLKNKWVQALRSGKYKQGIPSVLKRGGKYCCLGVLCEISTFKKMKGEQLPQIRNKMYIPEIDTVSLAGLNDGCSYGLGLDLNHFPRQSSIFDGKRFTFDEIADLIQISDEI